MSHCLLLIVILRSTSSKSKAESSPKTPSSPLTPTFAPSICLLAPCYLTGDSVRDKCVEMLSAALKADGEKAWAGLGLGWASQSQDSAVFLSLGSLQDSLVSDTPGSMD